LKLQEQVQSPWEISAALYQASEACRFLGLWTEAHGYIERALAIGRRVGSSWWGAYPLITLGQLCSYEGRWEQAEAALQEALDIAGNNSDLQGIVAGTVAQAELSLLQGNATEAIEQLQPLLDHPDVDQAILADVLVPLAAGHAGNSALATAEELIEQALDNSSSLGQPVTYAEALLVRGEVLAAQGRLQDAIADLEVDVRLAREMEYPNLQARSLYALGLLYGEQGDRERTRDQLEEALTVFERLRAQPHIQRTQQALTELQ
jgi:tetratricopeptide (TPR) repeat protein